MSATRERGWERWLPWLGALLGLAGLLWVLRGFDLERFRTVIAGAHLPYIALVVLIVLVEQIVRAWKWRLILWPLRPIATLYLFGAIMSGYLLAVLVPFGFGTVARSWLAAKRENLKLMAVLATVALDRLTDGLVFVSLVPIAVFGTAFPDPSGGVRAGLLWGSAASAALFILLLIGLDLYRRQAARPGHLVQRISSILPVRLAGTLRSVAASFAEGILWPQQLWRGTAIILASLAIKLFAASQFWAAALAFGVTLRSAEYLFVMIFLGFLVIVGHFLRLAGGFLIGALFALRLFEVPQEEALAMAVVVQAANLLSVVAVGAIALWVQGIALSEARNTSRTES